MPSPKDPVFTGGPGALAHPTNSPSSDSVVNNKYQPLPECDPEQNWIPSTYLWAFSATGIQIARAVTHMRDSIECFLRIHKANPEVAIITSKPMNLLDAAEEVLWRRES